VGPFFSGVLQPSFKGAGDFSGPEDGSRAGVTVWIVVLLGGEPRLSIVSWWAPLLGPLFGAVYRGEGCPGGGGLWGGV